MRGPHLVPFAPHLSATAFAPHSLQSSGGRLPRRPLRGLGDPVRHRHPLGPGEPLSPEAPAAEGALQRCQGLIVIDYGKGVVTKAVLERALGAARAHGLPTSVDPKESHIDAYRGVSILTPNQNEAGYVMGMRITDDASLQQVG